MQNDRGVVLEAVKNGNSLVYANEKLKNDREIVLEAVKKDGNELRYASEELQNDEEIVLETFKNKDEFKAKINELRGDKKFILSAIKDNWRALFFASEELKNDKEIVSSALNENALALQYASKELKNDKEVIQKVQYGLYEAIQYASEELKNDRNFIRDLVKKDGYVLLSASKELKNDREIVYSAVGQVGSYLFEYASEELKNDKEFLLKLQNDLGTDVLRYTNDELRNDREFVQQLIKAEHGGGSVLRNASEELKSDREFVLKAIKEDGYAFKYISEELKNDKEVATLALQSDKGIISSMSLDMIREFIKKNPALIEEIEGEEELLYNLMKDDVSLIKSINTHNLWMNNSVDFEYLVRKLALCDERAFEFTYERTNYLSDEIIRDIEEQEKVVEQENYDPEKENKNWVGWTVNDLLTLDSIEGNIREEEKRYYEYTTEILENYKEDPFILKEIEPELLGNKGFMLRAIKVNPQALEYASDKLKNDKEFMQEVEMNTQYNKETEINKDDNFEQQMNEIKAIDEGVSAADRKEALDTIKQMRNKEENVQEQSGITQADDNE